MHSIWMVSIFSITVHAVSENVCLTPPKEYYRNVISIYAHIQQTGYQILDEIFHILHLLKIYLPCLFLFLRQSKENSYKLTHCFSNCITLWNIRLVPHSSARTKLFVFWTKQFLSKAKKVHFCLWNGWKITF